MTVQPGSATTTTEGDVFLVELGDLLTEHDLVPLEAPLIQKIRAGELTRDELTRWAKQFYVIVREAPRGIANDYVNCPDAEIRREIAESLYDEETGRISGTDNHAELFRTFLAALGISRDEADATVPVPEMAPLFKACEPHRLSSEEFYDKIALDALVGEGAMAEIAETLFELLQREPYGFSPAELVWFSLHAEADKDHGEAGLEVLRSLGETAAGRERIRGKVVEAGAFYRRALDTYRA